MAYKDIPVYLDPTAESVERLRFSVDLAKTHGARLIGVDASTLEGAAAADSSEVVRRMFDEATRAAGLKTVFVPPESRARGTPSPIASTSSSPRLPAVRRETWSGAARSTAL